MKLLLIPAGFRTKDIAEKAAELTGKPLKDLSIAIISEAFKVESGDKSWLINELCKVKSLFGGKIDVVDLQALSLAKIKDRISSADITYVLGGNTDYLMKIFNETGFKELLLTKILKDKVYIGSSA